MGQTSSAPTRVYRGLAADERRAQRRAQLLDAGLELLSAGGWGAATVTAVCERARLTPRYFYESFSDRDEFVVAIFDAVVVELTEKIDRALAGGPVSIRTTVRATIAAMIDLATNDPRKARVMFVEAGGSEAMMRRRVDTMRSFAELVTSQIQAAYDVPASAEGVLQLAGLVVSGGLIETMIEWVEGGLDRAPQDVIDDFTNLCTTTLEAAIGRSQSF